MSNYLNAMNLDVGLLAHFGKGKLEIYGVASKESKKINPLSFNYLLY